jgi:hypothetical protein
MHTKTTKQPPPPLTPLSTSKAALFQDFEIFAPPPPPPTGVKTECSQLTKDMCKTCRGRIHPGSCACACPLSRIESIVVAHIGMVVTILFLLA